MKQEFDLLKDLMDALLISLLLASLYWCVYEKGEACSRGARARSKCAWLGCTLDWQVFVSRDLSGSSDKKYP